MTILELAHDVRLSPEELNVVIQDQISKSPDIQSITILSTDGLPIASTSSKEEEIYSAMAAASISLSERVLTTLQKGKVQDVMISGSNGFVMIRSAGENAVVSITARGHKNYGLVRVIAKRIATQVAEKF
ncbi:MAG: roadblock/LC7 domain-containing protein [Candidatus Hodarchaeota archaeon]